MKFLLPLVLAGAVLVTSMPHDAASAAEGIVARAEAARCPGNVFSNKATCNRKCPGQKACTRVQFPSGPTVGWACPCGAGAAKRSIEAMEDGAGSVVPRDESLEPRACPGNVFANKETCNRKCPGKKQCIRVQFPSGPTVGWACPCGAGATKRSDDPVDAVFEKVERDESLEPRACPNKFFHDEGKCNKKCPGKKRCGEIEVRGPEGPIKGWKCACAL